MNTHMTHRTRSRRRNNASTCNMQLLLPAKKKYSSAIFQFLIST
ncbi:unnamed protein product [Amoebophrya sp. A25]|nr:unnamed protein product [Amoebophrya sp. A25]|eukprot:GSA25T00023503001.1